MDDPLSSAPPAPSDAIPPVTNGSAAPDAPVHESAANGHAPSADNLESILAEFDRETAKPAEPEKPAYDPKAPVNLWDEKSSAEHKISALENFVHTAFSERDQLRNAQDGKALAEMARAAVADMPVPDGFGERWLAAEYSINPEIKEIWDHRYDSPQHSELARKTIDKVMRQLVKAAKNMPDRDATEDRAAVTAAVRGASQYAPEPKPKNYSGMSDAEFRSSVKQDFGFTPG